MTMVDTTMETLQKGKALYGSPPCLVEKDKNIYSKLKAADQWPVILNIMASLCMDSVVS